MLYPIYSFTTVVRIVDVKFLGVFLMSLIVKSHFNYSHDGSKEAYVLNDFKNKMGYPQMKILDSHSNTSLNVRSKTLVE